MYIFNPTESDVVSAFSHCFVDYNVGIDLFFHCFILSLCCLIFWYKSSLRSLSYLSNLCHVGLYFPTSYFKLFETLSWNIFIILEIYSLFSFLYLMICTWSQDFTWRKKKFPDKEFSIKDQFKLERRVQICSGQEEATIPRNEWHFLYHSFVSSYWREGTKM